jgi:hypothetical protein
MAEQPALDAGTEKAIKEAVGPELISMGAIYGVALAAAGISTLIGINYKSSTMAGDSEIHPTKDETTISSVETAATETEGKLVQDKVAAVNGEVKTSETEARALTGEATAAQTHATKGIIEINGKDF